MAKRAHYPMPADIEKALKKRGVMPAYRERSSYQQNDYIGWITRAKREETRQKPIDQMLDELERGGVYMNMTHNPSAS